MQNVAINWQILETTNSATMLGLVGLVRLLPILVFSLVGGVAADSYSRRKIMYVAQGVMAIASCLLAIITMLEIESPHAILALAGITSAAGAFDGPAHQSLLPKLIPAEHLANAVSFNALMIRLGMVIGPAVAGMLIGTLGMSVGYWANAATFIMALGTLGMMGFVDRNPPPMRGAGVAALIEGLRFVGRTKMILWMMMLDFFAAFFASASALLPVFARDILHVGVEGLGVLYAVEAIGAVVAGLAMSLVGDIRRKGIVLLSSIGVYGLATTLYGLSTSFWLSILLLGLVGAGNSISVILRMTIRFIETPDHLRGRMTAANMIFFLGGPHLGNLEAGVLAGVVGAPASVAIGGAMTVMIVALAFRLLPRLRRYE